MKKAKFFRYHVLGLVFWTAVPISLFVGICKISLPPYLQSNAIGDCLGLLAIPSLALCLWFCTLAAHALGGAYDEPTEWDELIEQNKK